MENINVSSNEVLNINGIEHEVIRVEKASELGKNFGLKISREVPVYFLKGIPERSMQGGYHPEGDFIVIFEENNTDRDTLEHELVHAIEYHVEPTQELLSLYEKAKQIITEESFEGNLISFNFMKNIHEFIADGKTKLKPVLEKEGLLEDFERETAYIFN